MQLNNALAGERALHQGLTAADERADVLETENKRFDLMVSQSDNIYDMDRMQFKARVDVLEGLLADAKHLTCDELYERIDVALKLAEVSQ